MSRAKIKDINFNHTRELVYVSSESGAFAILDYPSLELLHKFDAHVHECSAIGVELRGRYVATGGGDALVNVWDTQQWICQRTIPSAEYASSQSIMKQDWVH